jgi:hypothetical protein
MTTRLHTDVKDETFEAAYRYVLNNYAFLFHDSLREVKLLYGVKHHRGAAGVHIRYGGVRGYSVITLRHSQWATIPKYVEVLVHELTHLAQWTSGRAPFMTEAQMEAEAYPAGFAAMYAYQYRAQAA